MRRRTALAGVVAGLIAVAGAATPAYATVTPEMSCFHTQPALIWRLHATAEYTDYSTGLRKWTSFRFMVHGGPESRDSNNVNIRMSEYGEQIFSYNSSDNLEFNRWYSTRPSSPVYTHLRGPNGERDHRTNALIEIEAIFDRDNAPDPRCTATGRFE